MGKKKYEFKYRALLILYTTIGCSYRMCYILLYTHFSCAVAKLFLSYLDWRNICLLKICHPYVEYLKRSTWTFVLLLQYLLYLTFYFLIICNFKKKKMVYYMKLALFPQKSIISYIVSRGSFTFLSLIFCLLQTSMCVDKTFHVGS